MKNVNLRNKVLVLYLDRYILGYKMGLYVIKFFMKFEL